MAKCNHCGVTITDDTNICPLCRCVLEKGEPGEMKYPNIVKRRRKLQIASRIYLFLALITEAFLIYLNVTLYPEFLWCLIPGCLMACIYLTLYYFVNGTRSSYGADIVFAIIALVSMLNIMDKMLGDYGWSFNYVQPALVIAGNIVIFILILTHPNGWQSYLMTQLLLVVLSLLAIPLFLVKQVTHPLVSGLAIGLSFLLFAATIILGGARAKEELYRRFHI